MEEDEIRQSLEPLKLKTLKELCKKHNLHYVIKLTQKKKDLINDLIKFYKMETQKKK